ncbi:MAG: M6 family metalloprotease domain-containing protein [Gemmatimonadetes bacterium]|nr:M6 family metalloprotease domain-containing protein [Gemmatimonadota bacterium]
MTARAGLLVALLLAGASPPAAAQYAEPLARRPGVSLPAARAEALAAEAERLGFPAPGVLPSPTARLERVGSRGMVVIPALFADSPEPHVTAEAMQASLFDGPAPRGTIGDFYSDQSGGLFTIVGKVAPWVRTSVTLVEAAGADGTFGERLRDWVREAVALADASLDFGRFDNDGADGVPNSGDDDGTVDGIAIQYLEVAGSCGGPGIWPHLSGLFDEEGQPYATNDRRPDGSPVVIQIYIADSAVDCDGVEVQGPEIMAHEIGHLLGLPDYYRRAEGLQPWQRHWAVGCFDTMGAGSWGCGTGGKVLNFGPTGFSALSRSILGWATLQPVGAVTDETLTLEPLQTSFTALEVPLTDDGRESFIVEYRPRIGYDENLPGGGVLVYHHDRDERSGRWIPPELPPAYGYHVVEADGDDALRKVERLGGDRGRASDVFALNGVVDSIGDATRPSTRDHLGRPTRVRFHEIRIEGGVARIRLSTRVGFAVADRRGPSEVEGGMPFSVTSRFAGGTLPLEVTEVPGAELPEGFQLTIRGDELSVSGIVTEPEAFRASLRVRDAAGAEVVRHSGQRLGGGGAVGWSADGAQLVGWAVPHKACDGDGTVSCAVQRQHGE